ncbi:unnamed protein product [Rotaria sp. Silwood2]|nr:unnamed protein product [Rotaria sp. Silwood2]
MKRPFYSATESSSNLRDHLNTSSSTTKATSSINGCVRFNDLTSTSQTFDEREKYLTAKYPQQQMQLIRKRLKVEFWLDDQLRFLYDIKDNSSQEDHDQCPEDLIDCLLDMDNESKRRRFLIEFIDELLHRVKML